ncbi:MAG TPA: L,D-transpeptidase [Tenuifilaceae bacterium]|nr:L,D-transpeptidase [Tenuifilaceae bacterium]HPI44233.1 L,D-transpeptidase [Tenuifilaceae bacterium]HPN20843.1 L,D-transpeptidase [Tenuifilaceae bacterium]HPV57320.1 L,D-transpeptidase [Tenuifilaceae bacterium]
MEQVTDNNAKVEVEKKRPVLRFFIGLSITLTSILLIVVFVLYALSGIKESYLGMNKNSAADTASLNQKQIAKLDNLIKKNSQKFYNLTPSQPYFIVNTTYNRFKLYKNKKQIREGFCSTGSYTLLKSHDKRQWIFKTPKGLYKIIGKVTNPVWRRPDWSFVEEGLPIPSQNDPIRWEAGVLGDYALSIGDGYLIHGTIYKRFLGMPVTHGCIRMNDEDLEAVYKTLDFGSKVYIF